MTTRIRSFGRGLIMGAVAVVSVLCIASAALANSCTVNGTFMLTTTDSSGRLFLRDDGHAGMILPGRSACIDLCGDFVTGTYETRVTSEGVCLLDLDFRPQPGEFSGGRPITMSAAVAFQGVVLMFLGSNYPGLGAGLAIRLDLLTGQ